MNGLLKLQARATWAILIFLFLAIVSTLLITALADSDTGRPPDWDRSVPASLLCGLAKSGCQPLSLEADNLRPPAKGDQGIQPTPKCWSVGIISRSSYYISAVCHHKRATYLPVHGIVEILHRDEWSQSVLNGVLY